MTSKQITDRLILSLATGFGVGRAPLASGTFGSVLGVGVAFLLYRWELPWSVVFFSILGSVILAIWVCDRAEKIIGSTDPPSVVLDEIVAMPICFLIFKEHHKAIFDSAVTSVNNHHWWWITITFGLFRFFDIVKPWPASVLQRLPGGWGIVLDDLAAAGYVCMILDGFFLFK